MSQRQAYRKAFDAEGMSDPVVDNSACDLEKLDKITVRLEQLQEDDAVALGLTESKILKGLADLAFSEKVADGARVAAHDKISKILGLNTKDRDEPSNMTDDEVRREIEAYEEMHDAERATKH